MTLDLRAFSRTHAWFSSPPAATTHWDVNGPEDAVSEVDYEVSELTLTRTLRVDDTIELR